MYSCDGVPDRPVFRALLVDRKGVHLLSPAPEQNQQWQERAQRIAWPCPYHVSHSVANQPDYHLHHLTWLLVRHPERLTQQDHMMLAFIREVQDIDITYQLAQRFFTMVKERHVDRLDLWLQDSLHSGIPDLQTFAEELKREYAAIKAALTLSYSNGPVEGHVNKLKYIKRSMYGRGSFELLRQRVLQTA